MTRLKRRLANLALVLASTVLTVGALELVFRLEGVRGDYHGRRNDAAYTDSGVRERVPYGFVPWATILTTYDSDPRGYFGPGNTISHHFNSAGWRDTEHSLEKPPNTYRILGLGDSYLYGQGVKPEDICLTRLGTLLQRKIQGTTIECINAGISAMNTSDEQDLLVHRGLAYAPDLVVVHFVPNDVEPDVFRPGPKIEFFEDYVATYSEPDPLSKHSYLWSWARQRVLRAVRARRYIRESLASFSPSSSKWRQCRQSLDQIQETCQAHGVSLLVVIFPFFVDLNGDYPFQPIHDVVREHCRSRGIPCLDLRDAYRAYNGPELWVHPSDQHPNEIAHRIAAGAMAEYLQDHPEIFQVGAKITLGAPDSGGR